MVSTRRALIFGTPVLLWAPLLAIGIAIEPARADPSAHWLFDAAHVENARVKDIAGSHDAIITGPVRLRPDFSPGALLINRELNRVAVEGLDSGAPSSALPRKALTVEAWVSVEKTVEWRRAWGVAVAAGDGVEAFAERPRTSAESVSAGDGSD